MYGKETESSRNPILQAVPAPDDSLASDAVPCYTADAAITTVRNTALPFRVNIRHNVHAGNLQEMKPLREFVEELCRESGNDLRYYAAAVKGSTAAVLRWDCCAILLPEK